MTRTIPRNDITHRCNRTINKAGSKCPGTVTLAWDKRSHLCRCGVRYLYIPTQGTTYRPKHQQKASGAFVGPDYLAKNRLRKGASDESAVENDISL